ncbi:MAG TPA: hypothetical protein VK146_16720 [Tabrizicola sp.]|nr:hypothetical protein [Tabrizicola sp.]
MLEMYFKKGAVFEWTRPQTNIVPPDGALMDKQRRSTPMKFLGTIADMGFSSLMDAALPANYFSGVGLTPGTTIRYKWLDYAPGRTARVEIRTRDILTGPMSGCPILHWRQGANSYVGHVGTIFGNAPVNTLVKASIQPVLPATARGFNPAAPWPFAQISPMMGGKAMLSGPEILAYVTSGGVFYSTVFYALPNPRSGMPDSLSAKVCAGSVQCPPVMGAALQALLN